MHEGFDNAWCTKTMEDLTSITGFPSLSTRLMTKSISKFLSSRCYASSRRHHDTNVTSAPCLFKVYELKEAHGCRLYTCFVIMRGSKQCLATYLVIRISVLLHRSTSILVCQERMRTLQVWLVVPMVMLLILGPLVATANFHVVNIYYGYNDDSGFDYQMVIPSTKWGCGGVSRDTIAGGKYPDCYGGYDLHVPDNTCGCSGVTIRPACNGRYFGKVHGKDGGAIGDCYWNDAGDISAFTCKLNVSDSKFQIFYDRLLCSTKMCGS